MVRNYILIAARVLQNNLFFSFIIVLGLAISYGAFHWLWFYADQEMMADQFHADHKKIHRVYYTWRYSDDGVNFHEENWGPNLFVAGPWLKARYEEIDSYSRIVNQSAFRATLVGHDSEVYFQYESANHRKTAFKEENVAYADVNLFSFFNIPLITGDRHTALRQANSVAVSQSVARKYFGDEDPMGKIILLNGATALTISGVFQDLPSNTHLNFNIVISNARFADTFTNHDFSGIAHTYIKLAGHVDEYSFMQKLQQHDREFWKPIHERYVKEIATTKLQALDKIVYASPMARDNFQQKSMRVLIILKTIAALILMMGWINYVTLTFSRVMKRMKELATRKTFGAGHGDIFFQFYSETLLVNVLAIALALSVSTLAGPWIEGFSHLRLNPLPEYGSVVFFYVILVLTGCFVITLYPTLMARTFSINKLVRTSSKGPGFGRSFLKGMSVIQYSISIILILWVFVMNRQVNFLLRADTGIDKERVVIIDGPLSKSQNYVSEVSSLGNELMKIDGVAGFTSSHSIPGDKSYRMMLLKAYTNDNNAGLYTNGGIDETFIPFYNIKILAGRNFLKDMPGEANSILISKVGAERLGWLSPEEAVGQSVVLDNWGNPLNAGSAMIITGVFDDYSLYPFVRTGTISQDALGSQGLFFTYKNTAIPYLTPDKISVRINGDHEAAIASIEKVYNSLFMQSFFNWYFLDQHFNRSYQSHLIFRSQVMIFACLAIFISCLGLLGSSSFMAVEKMKELALRKVLGAGSANLIGILVSSTTQQILLALIAGLPVGYWFIREYLTGYTVKVSVEWWIFLVPLALLSVSFFITILPILYRTIKISPINALKNN